MVELSRIETGQMFDGTRFEACAKINKASKAKSIMRIASTEASGQFLALIAFIAACRFAELSIVLFVFMVGSS